MNNFFPDLLITYLLSFRQAFSLPGFRYFQGFIVATLLLEGRKCITRIASACFFIDKSLASWERFLAGATWDLPQVTESLIDLLVQQLGDRLLYANRYLVGIDTTYAAKVKGRMQGVQRWKEKSQNPDRAMSVVGHHWAIAGLLSRIGQSWRCFPLLSRLISGNTSPSQFTVAKSGETHRTTFWEVVLAVIFQVTASLTQAPICVVADAYFAKAPFLNPLIQRAIGVVSRLRHDAVGWDDPIYCGRGRPPDKGKKWRIAQLFDSLPHQSILAHVYGKTVEVQVVMRDLWLRDVTQKVRVVVVEGINRPILLISTSLSLTAQEIVEIYAARFCVELAIRDLKQSIGFCDYQSITTIAFIRFTQLCCCAASIGQLILAKGTKEAWLEPNDMRETDLSFRRLRRGLRRFVIRRLLFSKSASATDLEKSQTDIESILRIAA